MGHYKKKPVVIEAIQLGTSDSAVAAALKLCINLKILPLVSRKGALFEIETFKGLIQTEAGNWLIKGIKGEFYFCDNEVFKETYDNVLLY